MFQREELSDFDRFKLRKAKQIRNKIRTNTFYRLKKNVSKNKVSNNSKKTVIAKK